MTDELVAEWINGWVGCIDGRMHAWVNEQKDGCMHA